MYLILFIKRERKRKNNMMKNMNLSTNQTVHFVMKCLKLIQKLSRRAILSGLTPYVRGLLLSRIHGVHSFLSHLI